ncbi:hypothetical protein D3C78_1959840 [compost metagenome]
MAVPLTYDFKVYGPVPITSRPPLKSATVGQAPVTPHLFCRSKEMGPCSTMPFHSMAVRVRSLGSSG